MAVELRRREKRRRRLEDLVSPAQLGVVLAQPDQLGVFFAGHSRPGAGIDLGPLDSTPQRLGLYIEQLADAPAALDRRPLL